MFLGTQLHGMTHIRNATNTANNYAYSRTCNERPRLNVSKTGISRGVVLQNGSLSKGVPITLIYCEKYCAVYGI